MKTKSFFSYVMSIAVPVALQSMLQSSFSMIDQVMVGQLGSTSIAAIGIAGKFAFMYATMVGAVAAIAGIMISQYMGQKNFRFADKSVAVNLTSALSLGTVFMLLSLFLPNRIMNLYSEDTSAIREAANYLKIISATYVPLGIASILSVMLRCSGKAQLPLYASVASAFTNTGLNYLLIFGKFGCPALGVKGAAIASVVSQIVNALVVFVFYRRFQRKNHDNKLSAESGGKINMKQYFVMLLPVLLTEFLWSFGQNVYTLIYGHIGTKELAAVALISPVESLLIGALSGLAQAAGILIGKRLGEERYDKAYSESKLLMMYGFVGSVVLSLLLILLKGLYVGIYNVEDFVRNSAVWLLVAFAVLAPFKVQNMILGNGILRSGGKTHYIMWIDLMGTWVLGVPLGFLASYHLHFPVEWVYFIIGLEEIVRWIACVILYKSKKWIVKL